jgi:hypothetical protein
MDGGNPKNADTAADAMKCHGRLRIKAKKDKSAPEAL